jgi:hypothetical protein
MVDRLKICKLNVFKPSVETLVIRIGLLRERIEYQKKEMACEKHKELYPNKEYWNKRSISRFEFLFNII